jgi:23S rRNA (uracil1939-C5)-methyltransferase
LEARIFRADVQRWIKPALGSQDDLLLLDPPRSGLGKQLCSVLRRSGAGRLLLLGCDGASFCRDAKALAPAWQLSRLAAIDLFPNTSHVELVGLFTRSPAG